jgi:hypothetical protein
MKLSISRLFVVALGAVAIPSLVHAGPTAADVGDLDSFGHQAIYMGAASSGLVTLSPDCSAEPSPAPTPPDSQCFTMAVSPATTSFDAEDICRIKLPKKATRDIIYPIVTIAYDYQFQNPTAVQQDPALFTYTVSLTIESDVLNDPSIIDPFTGVAAMGRLQHVVPGPITFRDDRSLAPFERARSRVAYSRSGNNGFTKSFLVGYGLAPSVVDDLFKSAMTIRVNVDGTARWVSRATLQLNMRLLGDQ